MVYKVKDFREFKSDGPKPPELAVLMTQEFGEGGGFRSQSIGDRSSSGTAVGNSETPGSTYSFALR